MTTFVISLIRSNVAPLVGALATWLVSLGLEVPEEARQGLITFLFFFLSAIYYLIVRLLEERFPQVGIMLGYAKSPDSYSKGPGVELTQKPNGDPEVTIRVDGAVAGNALTVTDESKVQSVTLSPINSGPAHLAEPAVGEDTPPRHSL